MAQRGTSSTSTDCLSILLIDFKDVISGTQDENPTQSQHTLTVHQIQEFLTKGFRNYLIDTTEWKSNRWCSGAADDIHIRSIRIRSTRYSCK